MPSYRDRDTLVLRAPDRRPVAEAAKVIGRELARRPRATLADVHLAPADRALAMFRANYPALADRVALAVLWARAHGHRTPAGQQPRRPCGWDMARVYARRHGLPIPRLDPLGLAVLGPPCPGCRAVVDPQPKPKAKPARPATRSRSTRMGRTRTSAKAPARTSRPAGSRTVRVPVPARALAAAAGHPSAGVNPRRAAENAAACRRMGMDPARWPHLTTPRP
jgi:hypothetical protein